MKRALMVGIDHYLVNPLRGCINDARRLGALLERNEDGSPNFECRYLLSSNNRISKRSLGQEIEELLATETDIALFYFSGHGAVNDLGGYLITSEATALEDGYPMRDLLIRASKSKVDEVIVILDCCHSGSFGNLPEFDASQTLLREGIAVLTASRPTEPSIERGGGGVFTTLICDAIDGGAADILGRVTVGALYAYVDVALGAWDQRPIFKAHLSKFRSLRQCNARVDAAILRLLPTYFQTPDFELPLDPTYEPDVGPRHEQNERTFRHLQLLRDASLLVPIGEIHLYYAAVNSKSCKLTPLGQFYWQLAQDGRI